MHKNKLFIYSKTPTSRTSINGFTIDLFGSNQLNHEKQIKFINIPHKCFTFYHDTQFSIRHTL